MNSFERKINQQDEKQETAEIINFERAFVKADVNEGFDRVAGTLTDTLNKPPVSLPERERQIIGVVIAKTYRYHKKWDWISREQFSEETDIADLSNITKILNSLIAKRVLIKDGKKFAINTVVSEWREVKKVTRNPKKVTSNPIQKSYQQPAEKLPATSEKLPATRGGVTSNPHNRKTILQKTINTIDKPAKRKSQVPIDFEITAEMQAWANENKIPVNLKVETEQFVDHYRAKGETRLDWIASWRTWMRNSKKFSSGSNYKNKSQPENFREKDYGKSTFNFEEQ
jgi:phage replication O-like protein O